MNEHGKPFIELMPVTRRTRPTYAEWEAKRAELGLTGGNAYLFDESIHDVRLLLADDASNIAVSAVSCWEIRLKWLSKFASGRRKGRLAPPPAFP